MGNNPALDSFDFSYLVKYSISRLGEKILPEYNLKTGSGVDFTIPEPRIFP
jgi:hypothetical protein